MATIDLGKVALVWKGTYAAGTTYESKDVVQFTDSGEVSSYIYVNASGASGQTPSTGGTVNTTYWNKMAGGAAGIWASGLALGTAGQVVKVNSGATALEFGGSGTYSVNDIQSYNYNTTVTGSGGSNYHDIAGGNYLNFTPTSTDDYIHFMGYSNAYNASTSSGGCVYTMFGTSTTIGSGDTKVGYHGQHSNYWGNTSDNYMVYHHNYIYKCDTLSAGTTYYAELAGATHAASTSTQFNNMATSASTDGRHRFQLVHYKKN